jgi:serine/threonine-protein kinase
VHRDVTPGNILVSRNGAVLLTDFGIARIHDGSMTEPGLVRGKAAYVAPEQVTRASRLDARADLYSLALTLYEALTGVHPFKRDQFSESLKAVVEGRIEPLEALRPDVTPGLAAALRKALSRRPEDRFPTARAFREALVDGPVATAPELAEFVRTHSGEALELETRDERVEGTRSVVTVTPTQLELPAQALAPAASPAPSSSRGALVALGALVGLAVLGVVSWAVLPSQKGEVRDVASQTVAPPQPPEPVKLTPVSAEVEAPPKAPEVEVVKPPEPKPAVRRPSPRPPGPPAAPSAVKVGYLSADASPWAEVLLGGKLLDRTPFAKFPLPTGKHVLLFRGPGGETRKRTVTVSEGAVTAVRVEF